MTGPFDKTTKADDELLAFIDRVMRFQDGTLNAEGLSALGKELDRDPASRELFIQLQLQSAEVHELLRRDAFDSGERMEQFPARPSPRWRSSWEWLSALAVAVLIVVPGMMLMIAGGGKQPNQVAGPVDATAAPTGTVVPVSRDVIMKEGVRAVFFGRPPVHAGTSLHFLEDYMLLEGMVKVAFPSGATAIIESPALFRILDDNRLAMETGECSVHAPDGAEGFQVVTPFTKVVDRGTRFSVKVHDNSDTEVQVVEGAADLYPSNEFLAHLPDGMSGFIPSLPANGLRLNHRESIRVGSMKDDSGVALKFNPDAYLRKLPDRIISYQATMDGDVADELQSVTVRRGGIVRTYAVDDLIPIQVTWFRADPTPDSNGHLGGEGILPARPQDWLEDRKLYTGVINQGGQPEEPRGAPKMVPGEEGTRGLGIRFVKPVVNGPGPDVVFFEIQCLPNLLDGDPFHVLPVHFRPGLHSHTVRAYDLTLNSPEALQVKRFYLHRYPEVVNTLEELKTKESQANPGVMHLRFHALAVGIDLSDLGYNLGEQVTELFFQHAAAGTASRVDPVFIGGLPVDKAE